MRIKLRFIAPLLIFLLIAFFFWKGMGRDPNLLPSMLVDKPMPSFTAETLDGITLSNADFKNKIILLNIWATWCANCRIEQPMLVDLAKNNGLVIYGIDYKDDKAGVIKYLNEMGNPYQAVVFDQAGKLARELGVYGTPETFLIDKKGFIRYRYVGALTLEVVEKDLLPRVAKLQGE